MKRYVRGGKRIWKIIVLGKIFHMRIGSMDIGVGRNF